MKRQNKQRKVNKKVKFSNDSTKYNITMVKALFSMTRNQEGAYIFKQDISVTVKEDKEVVPLEKLNVFSLIYQQRLMIVTLHIKNVGFKFRLSQIFRFIAMKKKECPKLIIKYENYLFQKKQEMHLFALTKHFIRASIIFVCD